MTSAQVSLGRLVRRAASLPPATSRDLDNGFVEEDPHKPVIQNGPLHSVHDQMVQSAVLRQQGKSNWSELEAQAFAQLRHLIIRESRLPSCTPRRTILEDQIAWGRSPVRLDLAGGWTDTPPYCIEHGGTVVNVAVDLNGQPPIQVFAKLSKQPELLLRSIDLGLEKRIKSYAELEEFGQPQDPFAVAKAALALAGFVPRFHSAGCFSTLEEQLLDFGAGLELSLLAAVPKGSGLGTSSILAATTLATLAEVCGLNWDRAMLLRRTLVLEQLLTTGGGWQDQAGALYGGIKVIQTMPGFTQIPALRWLPNNLFSPERANRSILLYYTGLTRMAKNILTEVVRGVFLNSPNCLRLIDEIGANTRVATHAIQTSDYARLMKAVRNSWRLNQKLDPATNPPAVQQILDSIRDYLGAAKLLGAGGGGYLLLFAKDETAAGRIRQRLLQQSPNACARFVQFSLSETGLNVSKS